MGTDECKALVTRLASEYKLGMSGTSEGENIVLALYSAQPEYKTDSLVANIKRIRPGAGELIISHIGLETEEMNSLVDANEGGLTGIGKHRHAELNALTSAIFKNALEANSITPVTYREYFRLHDTLKAR
jgi:hypothetical protein